MWQLERALPHLVNCTKRIIDYPFCPHLLLPSDLNFFFLSSKMRELETLKTNPNLFSKISLKKTSLSRTALIPLPPLFHPRSKPKGEGSRAHAQPQQQQHAPACCWLAAHARPEKGRRADPEGGEPDLGKEGF